MNPRSTPAIEITTTGQNEININYRDKKRKVRIHASASPLKVDLKSSHNAFAIDVDNHSSGSELSDLSDSESEYDPPNPPNSEEVIHDIDTSNLRAAQDSDKRDEVEDFTDDLENQSLIPHSAPIATPNLLTRSLQSIYNAGFYICSHPFSFSIATITALPSAGNAFLALSKENPDHLVNAWNEMDLKTKFLSLGNGFISESINGLMNLFFIVSAKEKLLDGFKHMCDSPADFVEFTLSIALGLASGVAAGIISYETFVATGIAISASVAGVSALVTAASRFLWTKNTIKRGRNMFDENARLQVELADYIKHIDTQSLPYDDLAKLRNNLNDIIIEISLHPKPDNMTENAFRHTQYEKFAPRLAALFKELQALHPNLKKEKKSKEYIAEYASLFFDISLAVIIAIPAYLTYLQKGFDGFNYLSVLMTRKDLSTLDIAAKRWIGFLSGVASAAGYFLSGLEVRETLTDLIKDMYQQPLNIAKNLIFIAANGITGTSIFNISSNILRKGDNIIGMDTSSAGATPYTGLSFTGGAMVNFVSSAKKAYPYTVPRLTDFYDVEKGELDLDNLLTSAQQHYRKKDEFKISRETGEGLRALGLFSQPSTTLSEPEENLSISTRHTSSVLI